MQEIIIRDPLAWYIAGPLLGLFVPAFLYLTGKELGISSSFRHMCAAVLPGRKKPGYLNYDWKAQGLWQLTFVAGLVLGGLLSVSLFGGAGVPLQGPEAGTPQGLAVLFAGGILVGFGTRWADGCTSGHTINGLSQGSPASLVASICFVLGGLVMAGLHIWLGPVLGLGSPVPY